MSSPKIVLITGASSGIGKSVAAHIASLGHKVYGTSRKGKSALPDAAFDMVAMDVDNDESVVAAVREIESREGRIDVVINNAGYGVCGALEDTSIAECKAQFETNFFGVIRVCHEVLPGMRARKSGTIINISSLGAIVPVPYHGLYCASKSAIEGLTESLRMEMKPFNVNVTMIEPGDFKTGFTDSRRMAAKATPDSPYGLLCEKSLKTMAESERKGADPIIIAKIIEKIIDSKSPNVRYVAAKPDQAIGAMLKKFLPSSVFESILMKMYG